MRRAKYHPESKSAIDYANLAPIELFGTKPIGYAGEPPASLLAGSPAAPKKKKAKPKSNGAMEARASMAKAAASSNTDLQRVFPGVNDGVLPRSQRVDEDECDRAMEGLFRELRAWRAAHVFESHSIHHRLAGAIDRYEASLKALVDEDERLAALSTLDGGGENSDPPL